MFTDSGSGGGPVLVRLSGGCSVRGPSVRLGWEEGCSSDRGTTSCLWSHRSECCSCFMACSNASLDYLIIFFLQDATGWENLDWSWKWVNTVILYAKTP